MDSISSDSTAALSWRRGGGGGGCRLLPRAAKLQPKGSNPKDSFYYEGGDKFPAQQQELCRL
jgi:hypothetical protein